MIKALTGILVALRARRPTCKYGRVGAEPEDPEQVSYLNQDKPADAVNLASSESEDLLLACSRALMCQSQGKQA